MINDDKRVLGYFNNLLDHTKDKEELTVNRQNIKYLVNKLEKYFILEHVSERNKEKAQERVQELEGKVQEITGLYNSKNSDYLKEKAMREHSWKQNKRYREVLNRIKATTKEGTTYRWAKRALEESE